MTLFRPLLAPQWWIMGIMIQLALLVGCEPSDAARRKQAENQLRQIELAIENYNQTYATPEPKELQETGDQDKPSP